MYEFRLLPGRIKEWCQGLGFLLPRCLSEKLPRVIQWARVLVALAGTNRGYEWVVGQWWETITMIAPFKENLNLLLCLTRVEANVDLKGQGQGFLEGRLQEQRMLGASTTTPSNNQLLREFKDKGFQGSMHSRVAWRL